MTGDQLRDTKKPSESRVTDDDDDDDDEAAATAKSMLMIRIVRTLK